MNLYPFCLYCMKPSTDYIQEEDLVKLLAAVYPARESCGRFYARFFVVPRAQTAFPNYTLCRTDKVPHITMNKST